MDILELLTPFIANAVGVASGMTSVAVTYVIVGWVKGVFGKFAKAQIDRILTVPMMFGEFNFKGFTDWLSPRRRPYKKFGKRIARWMRR